MIDNIRLLADNYIYDLKSYLPEEIEIIYFDATQPFPFEKAQSVDALLIRTVTKINTAFMSHLGSRLSFIGSASAGIDHVDSHALADTDITFVYSPGCNARSVAEYVFVNLILWAAKNDLKLKNYSLGILGMGNVGMQAAALAESAGINYVGFDPPRELRDSTFRSSTLSEIYDCDIITLHTPLHDVKPYSTYQLIDHAFLMKSSCRFLINAARGFIVDESDLLHFCSTHKQSLSLAIDCWENEPRISGKLLKQSEISTPHIAGYSIEAKQNATRMVVQEMLAHFGLKEPSFHEVEDDISLNKVSISTFSDEIELLKSLHPLLEYDTCLRKNPEHFNAIRNHYPLRHELHTFSRLNPELCNLPDTGFLYKKLN